MRFVLNYIREPAISSFSIHLTTRAESAWTPILITQAVLDCHINLVTND